LQIFDQDEKKHTSLLCQTKQIFRTGAREVNKTMKRKKHRKRRHDIQPNDTLQNVTHDKLVYRLAVLQNATELSVVLDVI
jgi:hypothetical protein